VAVGTAGAGAGVAGVLPADHFDPAGAVEQIRACLSGAAANPPRPAANPVETFTAEAAKLLRILRRVSAGGVLQATLDADPTAAVTGLM
jgi:hypothetical protein